MKIELLIIGKAIGWVKTRDGERVVGRRPTKMHRRNEDAISEN